MRRMETMRQFTPKQLAAQFEIHLDRAPESEHAAMLMDLDRDVLDALHYTYACGGLLFGAGRRLLAQIRAELTRRAA